MLRANKVIIKVYLYTARTISGTNVPIKLNIIIFSRHFFNVSVRRQDQDNEHWLQHIHQN